MNTFEDGNHVLRDPLPPSVAVPSPETSSTPLSSARKAKALEHLAHNRSFIESHHAQTQSQLRYAHEHVGSKTFSIFPASRTSSPTAITSTSLNGYDTSTHFMAALGDSAQRLLQEAGKATQPQEGGGSEQRAAIVSNKKREESALTFVRSHDLGSEQARIPSVAEVNAHAAALYAALASNSPKTISNTSLDLSGFESLPQYDISSLNQDRHLKESFYESVLGQCAFVIEQLCLTADDLHKKVEEEEKKASKAIDASRHSTSLMMSQRELLTSVLCEQQEKEKILHDIAVVAKDILLHHDDGDYEMRGRPTLASSKGDRVEDEGEQALATVSRLTDIVERRNYKIESMRAELEKMNGEIKAMTEYIERKERVKKLDEEEMQANAKASIQNESVGMAKDEDSKANDIQDSSEVDGDGIVDLISGLKRTSKSGGSAQKITDTIDKLGDNPDDTVSFRSPFTNQLHDKMRRTTFYI